MILEGGGSSKVREVVEIDGRWPFLVGTIFVLQGARMNMIDKDTI